MLCSHNNIIQFTSCQVTIYPKLQVGLPNVEFQAWLCKFIQNQPTNTFATHLHYPTFNHTFHPLPIIIQKFIHHQFSSITKWQNIHPHQQIFFSMLHKRFHEFCPHQLLMWNFNIYIIYLFVKLTYSCSLIPNVALLSPN